MNILSFSQFDSQVNGKNPQRIVPPSADEPVSASERLVREDVRVLKESAEEIKRLKEQVNQPKDLEKPQGLNH